MNSMKNGSSAMVLAGRARMRPQASARAAESARAARFGYQPSSSAIARIRSRVSSDTPGRPFSAYETAPFETPARSAMSLIVVRRPCWLSVLMVPLVELRREGARSGRLTEPVLPDYHFDRSTSGSHPGTMCDLLTRFRYYFGKRPRVRLWRQRGARHERRHGQRAPILSRGLPLGRRNRCLPDRGSSRTRRPRREHLGPLLRPSRKGAKRGERRDRLRLLPPLPRGHRPDARARADVVPPLGRVAADPPRRTRPGEPGGARFLRPRRRRAARKRDRAARHALSLGPRERARGRRRVGRAEPRRRLRRVCRGRRAKARRPRRALADSERALGDRLAR